MKKANNIELEKYFVMAYTYCIKSGYENEINFVRKRTFEDIDATKFAEATAYVIINSGMRNQVADMIFYRYLEQGSKAIRHDGKRKAIEFIEKNKDTLFASIKKSEDRINALNELPWIGDITKFHLARNLGLDYVKPDRHLMRLAKRYGFETPEMMCQYIARTYYERVGVVDVVLWRYCNLTGNYEPHPKKEGVIE